MKQKVFEIYQMTKKRFLKINYEQTILTMVIPTDAKRFLKINDARKIFKSLLIIYISIRALYKNSMTYSQMQGISRRSHQ